MKFVIAVTLLFVLSVQNVSCLDNGLALTPPMGWMHWERFRCVIDCELFPDECISEQLFRDMADRLASDGYVDAGYEYLIIDDCWLATERDADGNLQPDPERFPNGIKALADYVHDKGLKFGIYEDYGTYTCGGFPGSIENLERDANTFAEWGVDYLKLDGCYAELEGMEDGYAEMGAFLNQTGRPIVFSCSFPAYKELNTNYSAAVENCNLWRNYADIEDSWASVEHITKWFSDNQNFLRQFAGPGHWNDPDMLIIGNFGLSYDQSIAQMTIWSVMAAPLIMSVDLRTIKQDFIDILLNPDAISINQDPLGIPGELVASVSNINVWTKQILPRVNGNYSIAFGIANHRTDGTPQLVKITLADFGLDNSKGYTIKDVFNKGHTESEPTDSIAIKVNPTGAALLIVTPVANV